MRFAVERISVSVRFPVRGHILFSEHKSDQTQQAANSLLLAHEHSPDVNNKPISIPYLEQGYNWNITIFSLKVEF